MSKVEDAPLRREQKGHKRNASRPTHDCHDEGGHSYETFLTGTSSSLFPTLPIYRESLFKTDSCETGGCEQAI